MFGRLVCITGGREFDDVELIYRTLDNILLDLGEFALISGCARGADSIAIDWADSRGIEVIRFPADWDSFGNSAGAKRNKEMLNNGFDLLVAFPGGTGTEHMKRITAEAGIKIITVR